MLRVAWLCFFLSVNVAMSLGQGFTVTGTVTCETGNLLAGANIIVKGTDNGTSTNAEGEYTLHQVTSETVLHFSFVGYTTQEIIIGERRVVDVTLFQDQSFQDLTILGFNPQTRTVSAQERIILPNISDPNEFIKRIPSQMQYLFIEYTDGIVFYKNSSRSNAKLNYNFLLGEMRFINNDQVFALDNLKDVSMVTINDRRFYPYKADEFTEELFSNRSGMLRVRYRGRMTTYGKRTGYGGMSPTASVRTANSLTFGTSQFNPGEPASNVRTQELTVVEENMIISKDFIYYLVDSRGKYRQIKNIRSFTRHFPSKSRMQIRSFGKENNINFKSSQDLIRLLHFCDNL